MSKDHSGELYLAATYLKVVAHGDPSLVQSLQDLFGDRARALLESDYIYGEDIRAIFNAFQAQGMNSWLLQHGDQLDIASHGSLGFAVLSSPNLEAAMKVLAEFLVIRSSAYACEFSHNGTTAEFRIKDLTDDAIVGRWLIESGFRVLQQLIESVMAHPLGEHASIHFACSKPHYHQALTAFYGVPCHFNQTQHKICFPTSWCRIQSPLYDEANFKSNMAKCQELKLKLNHHALVKEHISLVFTNYFNDRFAGLATRQTLPSLDDLANGLNMSSRTMARKLSDEESSYKVLLEAARRSQACYLLKNTHLSIADVAYNLAYQEPANFVRAFKVWFNTTPNAWRRNTNRTHNE